jgi:hypothetical protein
MGASGGDAETAADARLVARRDRLMGELVSLERKRRTKALSAPDEARRQKVMGELERAWAALDRIPQPGDEGRAA